MAVTRGSDTWQRLAHHNLLRPIAMMQINIDNRDFSYSRMMEKGMACSDRGVIEQAEAL